MEAFSHQHVANLEGQSGTKISSSNKTHFRPTENMLSNQVKMFLTSKHTMQCNDQMKGLVVYLKQKLWKYYNL